MWVFPCTKELDAYAKQRQEERAWVPTVLQPPSHPEEVVIMLVDEKEPNSYVIEKKVNSRY